MRVIYFSRKKTIFFIFSTILLSWHCTSTKPTAPVIKDPKLKFLNEYTISPAIKFENTIVGGLSGIDYEADSKIFASISDDRSEFNPARYYTYHILIEEDKIDTVIFESVSFLRNAHQDFFPPFNSNKIGAVDPEALRFYNDKIIWSDEGLRQVQTGDTVLVNPRVFLAEKNGYFLDTFQLPDIFHMSANESGPRNNGGFEGLAISADKQFVFVSTEEPLLNDGPRAGLGDSSAIVRIIKFEIKSKKAVAQFAYRIEPVAHPVNPPNGFRVNGISDILFWDLDHLLVVERSYSTGRLSCTIRVYLADISNAQDISGINSLHNVPVSILPKKLLLNMDTLGVFTDNIEGVTFGPRLSNGKRSLIFIADNNFNPFERNQLLLFEVNE